MPKVREHTIELGREHSDKLHAQAAEKSPRGTTEHSAEYAILKLEAVVEHGLWSCYETFEDMLYDFYPDLPWDNRSVDALKMILADPRLPAIVEAIKCDHNFDLQKELEEALKEHQEHHS